MNILLTSQRARELPAVSQSIFGEKLLYHLTLPMLSINQQWVKIGQKVLRGLLWLPTRTRPDLSYSLSSAAQALTKDIELLEVKLRHLLQYINTTQTLGLLYPYPRHTEMTNFTVYSDASFAPSGKHSQSGYTIRLSFGISPIVACIFFMVLLGSIDLLDPSSFALRVCFCTLLQFCLSNLWVPCFLACPVPLDVTIALHFSVLLSLYCPAEYPLEVCLLCASTAYTICLSLR